MTKAIIIKRILLFTLWMAIGTGTVMLLVAAIQRKDANKCTGIEINIKGVNNNFFVDRNDIMQTIITISGGKPVGKSVGSIDLKVLEAALQKNIWIRSAQLFFDNNERLQVNVLEREPVARVFTNFGTTFYLDSALSMLPLSEKFSARLPVFTGFPTDKKVLLHKDSILLRDILTISLAIQKDDFYMAMIDQVDITPQHTFVMIPKFGNTIIVFGDGKNVVEKLGKLRLFYKEVIVKAGWNKYSEINVQYNSQVVAKRKGADEFKADSLLTLRLMQVIAENAERMSGDSLQSILPDNEHNTTNSSIIQESIERDDNSTSADTNEAARLQGVNSPEKWVTPGSGNGAKAKPLPVVERKSATTIKQPAVGKPVDNNLKHTSKPTTESTKQPKLVMPKPLNMKEAAKKLVREF